MYKILSLFCFLLILAGCSSTQKSHQANCSWNQAMDKKINAYQNYSKKSLKKHFHNADLSYPSKEVAFLVFKKEKKMQLYARNTGQWRFIKEYPVKGASGTSGPKLRQGDKQVPEGVYQIIGLNPKSNFHLSMQLNYPNSFDKLYGELDNRKNLGNHIFIHGDKQSTGCVAIGNSAIEQIFPLVYAVGIRNTTVVIAPFDMRSNHVNMAKLYPIWLPTLYQNINQALNNFPVAA